MAFANLLNERGITGLYPPGEVPINSMVLFDPVSQTDGLLNVNWPTNLRNPALVFVATAENRTWFPAMPVGADSIIVPIEGVHSDVGGSFNPDGISAVTLKIAHDYLSAAGVPMADIPVELQPNWERMYIHNSAIDNFGNVVRPTIGDPTQTVGSNRYYEGAGLGSITVRDALGRDLRVSPIYETRNGRWVLVGFNGKTVSVVTDEATGARTVTADITVYARDGRTIQGRNVTSATTDANGQWTDRLTVIYEADAVTIRSTSITERLPNNNTLTTHRDHLGNMTSMVEQQHFDDGTALQITTYPSGRNEVVSTDPSGAPYSRIDTIPGSGTTDTVKIYSFDAQGRPVPQSTRTIQRFDDGTRLEEVTTFSGGTVITLRNVYDDNNELLSSQPVERSSAVTALTDPQSITVLNDIADLISAIQGGRPLPVLDSGLRLANSFTANAPVPSLVTSGQLVGGLASLYSLSNALKNGDTLTRIHATVSTLNYVNSTLPQLLNGAGAAPLSAGLNGFLNGSVGGLINGGTPGVLPALGLIVSIKNGDPIGTVSGIIGLVNPAFLTTPVGWILAGASILQALMDEPPEAWGVARFVLDGNGQLQIDVQGEAFGMDRVRQQLQVTEQGLQQMLARAQISAPGTPLGVIAQRTASITWRERRQDDKGYAINDVDPITGEQRYPYLRWDDDGLPFSSNPAVWQPDPTDPNIRAAMAEQLISSALRREAIAPMWEVNTARMQQHAGDALAGLSEAERAARMGLGASYDAAGQPLGQFRAVTLDLDGNGSVSVVGKDDAGNTVGFDWDDSGFNKQVAWVQPNDGFLFLDRDSNGVVSSGKELFSNSRVSDDYKGVKSIEWVDANRDGKIDSLDPVFNQLRVWQDANQDGDSFTMLANGAIVTDSNEIQTLAELGISEIDYINARFLRNGELFALKSDALAADTEGTKVTQVGHGITIEFSDGRSQFVITQVTRLAGGADRIDGLYEDGDPTGEARAAPMEIIIPVSLLLANDGAAEGVEHLGISAVSAAEHGSVRLGEWSGQPVVFFMPEANYNSTMAGDAGFEYTVTNRVTGDTRNVPVTLPLQAVNDPPAVSVQLNQRSVFGWGVLATVTSTAVGEDASYTITAEKDRGLPFMEPYLTVLGRRQVGTQGWGEDGAGVPVWGAFEDTKIPKSYFDLQYADMGYHDEAGYQAPSSVRLTLDGQSYLIDAQPGVVLQSTPLETLQWNDGHVSAVDPDGPNVFSFQIVEQGLYGRASIDAQTGRFEYTGNRYVASDVRGTVVNNNIETDEAGRYEERFTDVFTVRVTDASGASIDEQVAVTHFGPRPNPNVQSGGKKPIAIDLDGDGFHFTDVDDSNVFLDINGDGWRRRTAWIEPGDGLLTFDENGNGIVDSALELSFARFVRGAQTDLEGLRAFDTNKDGVFSAADAAWAQFGVWQDVNANGGSDMGELRSLTELGFAEIALTSDGQFSVIDGQTVHGMGVVTKTDGSTLAMADATLRNSHEVLIGQNADGSPRTATMGNTGQGQTITTGGDKDFALGSNGSDSYVLGDGDDVVVDDLGDDQVNAGGGDDMIFTGAGNDVILAGAGNDQVFAGDGNDVVFGDDETGAGNDLIMLQGGHDVAFGGGGIDFISGGDGNDVISGDAGNDQLFGEDGWDALFGGEGDDELWGGAGNDLLDGGAGADVLSGGEGADIMQGGAGDDVYEVYSALDLVDETVGGQIDAQGQLVWGTGDAGGNDTVRSSIDFDLSAGRNTLIENLTLTGEAMINGSGNASNNILVGNSASNILHGLAGDDTLDGGKGADTLMGGQGNDTYLIDNEGDVVIEQADEGIDTVRSLISATLATHVENLRLTGTQVIDGNGNELDNQIMGNAAANTLAGGRGNDRLAGGGGSDRYAFNRGDGVDTLIDSQGNNTLVLGAGIEASDIEASLDGVNLILDFKLAGQPTQDRVVLQDWYLSDRNLRPGAQRVNAIEFADGRTIALDESALNTAPTVLDDAISVDEDSASMTTLSGNVLGNDSDPDESNVLSVTNAGIQAGQYGHLHLAGDGQYTYTPFAGLDLQALVQGHVISEAFVIEVSDNAPLETAGGASVLHISITGVNDAPVFAGVVSHQIATEIVAFELSLPPGTFTDADAGEVLTYSATLSDGAALPSWLQFDAETQTFSGEAAFEDIGSLAITVTATDSLGASATADLGLVVNQSAELTVIGTEGDDNLRGASRNDFMDGGGGSDVMRGGRGDDRYVVDNTADLITELFNQGNDSIYSSVNYVLPAHVENLFLTGSAAVSAQGNEFDNVLIGNAGDNILTGGAGRDVLAGWSGSDVVDGGQDGDLYLWNPGDGRDTISESSGNQGADVLRFGAGISLDSLAAREFINSAGQRNLFISVLDQDGEEQSDQGIELNLSSAGSSAIERFELSGANGTFSTFALDEIKVSTVHTNGSNGNDTLTGSRADDRIDGGNGNDLLYGRSGHDTLWGGNGQDRLFGEGGNDALWGGNDNDWLQGGAGNDLLDGGNGSDFIVGGKGNDQISAGQDSDVIAFNRGDGQDTFLTQDGQSDTLSLGGGIRYADLSLAKSGSDLVLRMGLGDQMTFKDWYLGSNGRRKNIALLQIITAGTDGDFNAGSSDRLLNKQAVQLDFAQLVGAFDAARSGNNAHANGWTPSSDTLNAAYVAGSNSHAMGGDLAWRYATLNDASGLESSHGDLGAEGVRTAMHGMGSLSSWTQLFPAPVDPWIALQAGISLISEQPTGANPTLVPIAPLLQDQLIMQALGSQAQVTGQSQPGWV